MRLAVLPSTVCRSSSAAPGRRITSADAHSPAPPWARAEKDLLVVGEAGRIALVALGEIDRAGHDMIAQDARRRPIGKESIEVRRVWQQVALLDEVEHRIPGIDADRMVGRPPGVGARREPVPADRAHFVRQREAEEPRRVDDRVAFAVERDGARREAQLIADARVEDQSSAVDLHGHLHPAAILEAQAHRAFLGDLAAVIHLVGARARRIDRLAEAQHQDAVARHDHRGKRGLERQRLEAFEVDSLGERLERARDQESGDGIESREAQRAHQLEPLAAIDGARVARVLEQERPTFPELPPQPTSATKAPAHAQLAARMTPAPDAEASSRGAAPLK
jgi:hypothetical protein